MYLNPVVGKSCNKPGVMEILGGPAGVGRSRKPCDGQTLRAVLLMEGGELEQRSSGHGGVKNDSMSQDSSTGKDGLGHRNRGLQNRVSPGEGSSRWVLVLGGCGAWGGAVACHTPPRSNGARHHGALWVLDVCLGPWAVVHGKTCGFARKKPQVVR